jgi:DNA-binding transcriptional ArsR family regulator
MRWGQGIGAPKKEVRFDTVETLRVIAGPRRMRILELVWDREQSAGEIAAQFDVTWSAISQHLRVLKAEGLVTERRAGRCRMYKADKDALGSLRSVVEEHWRQGLGLVKELAEAEAQARGESGR